MQNSTGAMILASVREKVFPSAWMQRAEVELDFPSLPQICSLVSDVWGFITVAFYENVISYLVRAKCCSIFGIFYGDGGGRREHDH